MVARRTQAIAGRGDAQAEKPSVAIQKFAAADMDV
jgi:hypothetical protein